MGLPGAVDMDEALLLEGLVRASQAKLIVETGCGLSTYYLAKGLGVIGTPGKVYVFEKDVPKMAGVADALRGACLEAWCEFIPGDSVTNIRSLLDNGEVGEIELAFMDSDHHYEHVTRELAVIYQHLALNGIMIGHDATHDMRAGRAYRDFAHRHGLHIVIVPSKMGLALIGGG